MFKAAKEGPAKVITANDLGDGLVVFLDQDGGWTPTSPRRASSRTAPSLDRRPPTPRRSTTRASSSSRTPST